jgi:hypothetical protein
VHEGRSRAGVRSMHSARGTLGVPRCMKAHGAGACGRIFPHHAPHIQVGVYRCVHVVCESRAGSSRDIHTHTERDQEGEKERERGGGLLVS